MNQIRESLHNVVFPDILPDSWPYQSWCSPADIDTDITWYSFTELDLILDVWLGKDSLVPVRKTVWGFVYENEPLFQINIKDEIAYVAVNRRFYSWVIIVAGTYNLNISLDLTTIFKHTALADTALCIIANRVDIKSADISLNTAKSFMNFIFFHELVHLTCRQHELSKNNDNLFPYIRTMEFIAYFLAFENTLIPLAYADTRQKQNEDLLAKIARCLGFVIASYFIIKTRQMSYLNQYPTMNERTILLLSYILTPYFKRSERAGVLLKHEAKGIMDAYSRREKLGFTINNDDFIITPENTECQCNYSKCSSFTKEVYKRARPLNAEILNHLDVYTNCFPDNNIIRTYPDLGEINSKTSYFCSLKNPLLFSLERTIKGLI